MNDDKPKKNKTDEDIIEESKKRFEIAKNASRHNREPALEDLEFLIGEQWPEKIKQQREIEQRPCLTMNQLPKFVRQVTGDARQNKPAIQVHPVDSMADPETAKIIEDLIRNIEYVSGAAGTYDTSLDQAAMAGFGYFRIKTQYVEDDTFEQEIRIQRIPNQFSVYYDPNCIEADCSDAAWCIVTEKISKNKFLEDWPNAEMPAVSVPGSPGDTEDWVTNETIRIAEYWYKEPIEKTLVLAQFPDGTTGVYDEAELGKPGGNGSGPPLLPEGTQILKRRLVKGHEVKRCVHTAVEVLEKTDHPGKYIPIVSVLGEEINVDGKQYLRGVIRFAKDPQRAYNYHWTVATELIALAPKSPWLLTPEMIKSFEGEWGEAHRKTFPYLLHNPDPMFPGRAPQREPFAQIPTASVEMLQISGQGLKDTTGIYDASLGKQSNETSGRAIVARQREGDTGTFVWIDNLTKAITFAGKILIDLIPKIYDTERIIRVRGKDDSTQFVTINTQQPHPETGAMMPFHDLTVGKYDVVIQVGPSYTTKRIEAANDMLTFMEKLPPQQAAAVSDLVASNMDWEGAKEIAERLKAMLPPQLGGPQPPPPPPMAPPPGPPPGIPPEVLAQMAQRGTM